MPLLRCKLHKNGFAYVFRAYIDNNYRGYLMDAIAPPEIRLAELQEDAVCIGAAFMATKYNGEEINIK